MRSDEINRLHIFFSGNGTKLNAVKESPAYKHSTACQYEQESIDSPQVQRPDSLAMREILIISPTLSIFL